LSCELNIYDVNCSLIRITMLEKYYAYLYYVMGYSYGLIRKSKKKGMQIYKFEGIKIIFLNDYNNRRLLVWFYLESSKQIFRVALHGYYVRKIRYKLVMMVKKIQEDESYFTDVIMKRRSFSYKQEVAQSKYMKYQNKLKG